MKFISLKLKHEVESLRAAQRSVMSRLDVMYAEDDVRERDIYTRKAQNLAHITQFTLMKEPKKRFVRETSSDVPPRCHNRILHRLILQPSSRWDVDIDDERGSFQHLI